ncbi:protein N-terminal glutamine amidohydrolase [Osmerus eperlanus]|uniref:protein N-terminal glutamine amidohydrolase n=1 Tax=Osmerus eperlanus TaxID=29151 RepID=UPI002E165B55
MHKDHSVSDYVVVTPPIDDCVYTSCYCEENVWKLCEHIRTQSQTPLQEVYSVFISNDRKMVPLWKQKSSKEDEPVVWDYHVILVHHSQRSSYVYDLDSTLPFPCPLPLYSQHAFQSDLGLKPAFWRKLRVVPAEAYLRNLASDRSHMRDADGSWRMPPPPYPCIATPEAQMNLDDFISMDPAVGQGRVFSLAEFNQHFTRTS